MINCSTCLELISPSDDLSSTPCGHLFHTACILQWFESKLSCPQCRAKCQQKQLRRIFLTQGQDTSFSQNSSAELCQKIDSLTFNVRCLETEKKKALDEASSKEAKYVAIKDELEKSQREKKDLRAKMSDLKERIEVSDMYRTKAAKAESEAKDIREKLRLYETVDGVIKSSSAEVMQQLHNRSDYSRNAREMATINVALKKEMEASRCDKRALKEALASEKRLNQDLKRQLKANSINECKLSGENANLRSDLNHAEEEIDELKTKIRSLQEAIDSPSGDPRKSVINRLLTDFPKFNEDEEDQRGDDDTVMIVDNNDLDGHEEDMFAECSQTSGLVSLKGKDKGHDDKENENSSSSSSTLSQFSIMKKSRTDSLVKNPSVNKYPEQFYNGFGGHSKNDEFPDPLRRKTASIVSIKKNPSKSKQKKVSNADVAKMKTIQKYFNFETP